MKGHEIEVVSAFRFYFQCKVSGILGWKFSVANLFCSYVRAEGTRGKNGFLRANASVLIAASVSLPFYQQLSSVIYSILS